MRTGVVILSDPPVIAVETTCSYVGKSKAIVARIQVPSDISTQRWRLCHWNINLNCTATTCSKEAVLAICMMQGRETYYHLPCKLRTVKCVSSNSGVLANWGSFFPLSILACPVDVPRLNGWSWRKGEGGGGDIGNRIAILSLASIWPRYLLRATDGGWKAV